MSIETPSEIFLRSRQQFLRSGDLEDAAEVYLSLLNLHQHGLRVHPSDTTVSAFNLLRSEKGLISDLSPRGDLLYKVDDVTHEEEKGRGLVGAGGEIERAKARADHQLSRKEGRLIAAKEGGRQRLHHTPGSTTHRLAPPPAFREILDKLDSSGVSVPSRVRRPLNVWEDRPLPNDKESINARELWNLIRWREERSTPLNDLHSELRRKFADSVFSHRPESTLHVSPISEYLYGRKGDVRNLPAGGRDIDQHPLESLSLWGDSKLHDYFRKLYTPSEGDEYSPNRDMAMKRWEEKHKHHPEGREQGGYPHHDIFGKHDMNSSGQFDIFLYGYHKWQEEMAKHYPTSGGHEDFIEHMILRSEGVPEDVIFKEFYSDDGSIKGQGKFDDLLKNHVDPEHRMGDLPFKLGLEALPTEEARGVVEWYIDGGHESTGPFGIPGEFFKNAVDGRGLLNRIFRTRDGALTSALNRSISEPSVKRPASYDGKLDSEHLDDMAITRALQVRGQHSVDDKPLKPRLRKTLYEELMWDDGGKYRGHLPRGDGTWGEESPVLTMDLLDEWVKNHRLTPKERDAVVKSAKEMRGKIQKDSYISDVFGPTDTSLMLDGDGQIVSCPWSALEHDLFHGMSMGRGASDHTEFDDDMYSGLWTDRAASMMSAPYSFGGKPRSRLRTVTFPDEESVGYSKTGGRSIDEKLSQRSGASTFASIHGGAQPLLADWLDEEDKRTPVDFYPWIGHRHSRDRDHMSGTEPIGSNIGAGAPNLTSSANPQLAQKKADTYDRKIGGGSSVRGREQKGEKGTRKGRYRRTMGLRGDAKHVEGSGPRRAAIGLSSLGEGSTFAQEVLKDITPEQEFHLLQLMLGHSGKHGTIHDFFEEFYHNPEAFLAYLDSRKNDIMPSELHGGLKAPLVDQLVLAGLTRKLKDEDGKEIEDSPTQEAEHAHALYLHRDDGHTKDYNKIFTGPTADSNGLLHGMEPNTTRGGDSMGSVAGRFSAFKKKPSDMRVEDLLIHPHRHLIDSPLREDGIIGAFPILRNTVRNDFGSQSQDSDYHRQRFYSQCRAQGMTDSDIEQLLEVSFPEGSERVDSDWFGTMRDYDTMPILDRLSSDLTTSTDVGQLSGFHRVNGGQYAKHFPKFLLSSQDLAGTFGQVETAVGEEEVSPGLMQTLGGSSEDTNHLSPEQVGIILGAEPYTLMMRHVEDLRELLDARNDDGKPLFPEDDLAGREKINEAIRQQLTMAHQYVYSHESGLGIEGREHETDNHGYSHYYFRRAADTLDEIGRVMHGLMEHWKSTGNELSEFEEGPEGQVNYANLFDYVDKLISQRDQSWRQPLAQSLINNGNGGLGKQILESSTREHWSTPDIDPDYADEHMMARMRAAMPQQSTRGVDILSHYLDNGWHGDLPDKTIERAKRALMRMKGFSSQKAFLDSISDHSRTVFTDQGNFTGNEFRLHRADGGDAIVRGFQPNPNINIMKDFAALRDAAKFFNEDSMTTGMALHGQDKQPLQVSENTKWKGKGGAIEKNWNEHRKLGRLLDRYRLNSDADLFKVSIRDREKVGRFPIAPLDGGESFAPKSLSSAGLKIPAGTKSNPSVDFKLGNDGIPEIGEASQKSKRLIHWPPNLYTGILGRAGKTDTPNFVASDHPDNALYWETPSIESKNMAQQELSTAPSSEGAGDYNIMQHSLDVLTDTDLLLKEGPKYSDTPPPVKPMHRIFSLDDLQHLRGFSGDWVVSSWPEGERLMITKKGNRVTARNAEGEKVDLPNNIRAGLRGAHKKGFIIDALWDNSTLLIVDILKTADETMENMPTKDRSRHLRANFEATEEVLIPAPINTKRTDESGLSQVVKDLRREKGVKQILLRDAEATYMRGEMRHPKWVLLVPEKQLDVIVLSSSGNNMCLGIGPILEEVAKKIGNRALKHEGSYYMDVGHLADSSLDIGQYITVRVTGVTKQNRKGESVYCLNSPRYEKDSESSATDSVVTLDILSGDIQKNIPHTVKVSKSSVYLNLPTGQVIYDVEEYGHGYILKDVDYPDDYTLRVAESQRDYWAPLAAVFLRSEKEKSEKEKEAVVPEPPANHDKDPKKVIPKKDRILKDPKVMKTMVTALEMIDSMLKEKITWTGPKALGIDYATPVESPSGPTKLTEPHHLPDHDPGHRQKKGGDCWCGAKKGEECQQGVGHKMEECPKAHPPKKEESANHLKISRYSRNDSSV